MPAGPALAREERLKKRKAEGPEGKAAPKAKTSGASTPVSAPKKTAVFVSNLPPSTTPQLLASVFSKAGVLLVDDRGEPRVKMYNDAEGKFKGEALVMYFKEGSVDLAITLLDDTELELGGGFGNMRVRVAEYDKSKKTEGAEGKEGKGEGEGAPAAAGGAGTGEKTEKKKLSAEDKRRMTKRMRTLERYVALTLFSVCS